MNDAAVSTLCASPLAPNIELLRLHRALLFVIEFVEAVQVCQDEESVANGGRQAYASTLAQVAECLHEWPPQHHSWIVRKTVQMALALLPTRRALIERMIAGRVTRPAQDARMTALVAAAATVWPYRNPQFLPKVYARTQDVMVRHGLVELP